MARGFDSSALVMAREGTFVAHPTVVKHLYRYTLKEIPYKRRA